MFADVPILARKYYIPGEWSTLARDYCFETIVEKRCIVKVIDSIVSCDVAEPCNLHLYTKEKDLKSALISLGYEVPKKKHLNRQ